MFLTDRSEWGVARPKDFERDVVLRGSQQGPRSGRQGPRFVLPNAAEQLIDSRALLANGPLVVTSYRGRW